MSDRVVLIGSFDTKGIEYAFVRDILHQSGVETVTINTGVLNSPFFTPDVSSDEVAAAGGVSLSSLQKEQDRGKAVSVMTKGVAAIVTRLIEEKVVGALFGMGGTAGTTVCASAMQAAPIGVPKLLVSTVASGNTSPYVGVKDIMMMYSVIDIAGINSLSRRILSNAAYALVGMIKGINNEAAAVENNKPMLGMTMFGVTTPCCTRVREALERKGFEILVFHATGTGGRAMEELIRAGFIQGVLDITTTELADDLVGGVFSAGPNRLLAAGEMGIPQLVSVGALDMVNFGAPETVPSRFKERIFYQHNHTTTLMRTTVEENTELGKSLAQKLNMSGKQTVLVFPHGGVSLLDVKGKPFDGAQQREALFQAITSTLEPHVRIVETDKDMNDPTVADLIVEQFLDVYDNYQNDKLK